VPPYTATPNLPAPGHLPRRAELKRRVRELVVPPYTALVQQHTQVPFSKNMDKYLRYTPRDVEGQIADLFESRGPGA